MSAIALPFQRMSRGLTTSQKQRVKAAMKDYVKREDLSDSEFARRLRVTQPAVWSIIKGSGNPGFGTAQAFARLTGQDVMTLLGEADDEPVEPEVEDAGDVDDSDPYYNRAVAISRLRGIVSAAAIERVRSIQLKADEAPTVQHWCEDLLQADRRIGSLMPKVVGERTMTEDDDEP